MKLAMSSIVEPRSSIERARSNTVGSPVTQVTSSWQRRMRQPSPVRTTEFGVEAEGAPAGLVGGMAQLGQPGGAEPGCACM